jgi:hypothetical protein
VADLYGPDIGTHLRRRRLEREALGARDETPAGELWIRTLYACGLCMILAALFL